MDTILLVLLLCILGFIGVSGLTFILNRGAEA